MTTPMSDERLAECRLDEQGEIEAELRRKLVVAQGRRDAAETVSMRYFDQCSKSAMQMELYLRQIHTLEHERNQWQDRAGKANAARRRAEWP